jgi:diadenosine tetraphosphatase ApaH/serine/threonine PP2A family protein phosphatase
MQLTSAGAISVKGNHDQAIEGSAAYLNDTARAAIEWTRSQLGSEHRDYLAQLPFTTREESILFVHASADAPQRWNYVDSAAAAWRSVQASQATYTFCGHVHDQGLYFERPGGGGMGAFRPVPGTAIPVGHHRRWLAIVGSVGQPRDGNPAAAYAIFDAAREEITFHRVTPTTSPRPTRSSGAAFRGARVPRAQGNLVMLKLEPGSRIGDFVLGERIHVGAMGRIFAAARSTARARFPVAVKVLSWDGEGAIGMVGLETEIMILPTLTGPHVPRHAPRARSPFALRRDGTRGGENPPPSHSARRSRSTKWRACAALADALHGIHEQGVVHHDVKPENIRASDGHVVLVDFGFARHERFPDLLAEEMHFAAGSAAYVSPDSCADRAAIRAATSISLGVILYELAAGEPPAISRRSSACAIASGDCPCRRAPETRRYLRGFRKSSCAASRRTWSIATSRPRTSRST